MASRAISEPESRYERKDHNGPTINENPNNNDEITTQQQNPLERQSIVQDRQVAVASFQCIKPNLLQRHKDKRDHNT